MFVVGQESGARDWTMGRTNANDVDLNRNFPNLNEFIQLYHQYRADRNNHLDIETFLTLTSGNDCHDQPVKTREIPS